MKYVIEWHPRAGGSSAENLATTKRSLEVFAKWTPSATVHQFVERVDGGGGFAVMETDDAVAMARDCAVFGPFLEVQCHPVLEMEDSVGAMHQAIDFAEHA